MASASVATLSRDTAPTLLSATAVATEKQFTDEIGLQDTMHAFGIRQGGGFGAIEEMDLPKPQVRPKDILVRVEACAMNAIDTKLRGLSSPPGGLPKVLGYDGCGIVAALGAESRGFSVGDRVFFAGSLIRNGTNAEFVAVDYRIVGRAPRTIAPNMAASVPLVALAAWEGLEKLGLDFDKPSGQGKRILVIPGAGGVGSYVIQLAKVLGLTVIATASRPESREACFSLGADHVINHRESLKPQLEALGINDVHYIYDAISFEANATQFVEIIRPLGKIVTIIGVGKANLDAFKWKAVDICIELMFTRPDFETEDIAYQSHILNTVSEMIDAGKLQTPVWKTLPWSLESLREAHLLQESGKAIGKIVMAKATMKPPTVEISLQETMLAYGIRHRGGDVDALEEMELPRPELRPKDILVRVEACAVNPSDTHLRKMATPAGGAPKVLGYDGTGTVAACGPESRGFSVGDRVFFAGSHIRNGTNAELVAVDSRIVGRAPRTIAPNLAASVPLVALTAWEGLEKLGLDFSNHPAQGKRLLIIPGAGGVGSYVIQLAKVLGLTVIATASRPESREACFSLGADHVINHRESLKPQLEALGINDVHYIYDAISFEANATQFVEIIRPLGKIVTCTKVGKANVDAFKWKAVDICIEFMYARSAFETEDIAYQSHILNTVSEMIDAGKLQTPVWKTLPWSLESLREAHVLQESGEAIGKIVMARAA